MNNDCDTHQGSLRPTVKLLYTASRQPAWASDLTTQGFAAELIDAFEVIPVVTAGELISKPVFTRLVLITAHARNIDANRHMMANKPV
jgi:hypothetical protein